MSETHLAHHGILGQKWGVRRYRNENGTLTEAGKKRYSYNNLHDDAYYEAELKRRTKDFTKNRSIGRKIGVGLTSGIGNNYGYNRLRASGMGRVNSYLLNEGMSTVGSVVGAKVIGRGRGLVGTLAGAYVGGTAGQIAGNLASKSIAKRRLAYQDEIAAGTYDKDL